MERERPSLQKQKRVKKTRFCFLFLHAIWNGLTAFYFFTDEKIVYVDMEVDKEDKVGSKTQILGVFSLLNTARRWRGVQV